MPGVAGSGGPVPKRSNQRRRNNKPKIPVTKAAAKPTPLRTALTADPGWHPAMRTWFESLAGSGQSAFYEASDWALAWATAETMSRELNPQPLVVGHGADAHVEMVSMPPKAAAFAAFLKANTSLMATEGDRRRLRLELERGGDKPEEVSGVTDLDDYRRRLANPAG